MNKAPEEIKLYNMYKDTGIATTSDNIPEGIEILGEYIRKDIAKSKDQWWVFDKLCKVQLQRALQPIKDAMEEIAGKDYIWDSRVVLQYACKKVLDDLYRESQDD